jgi:hypothetical protein
MIEDKILPGLSETATSAISEDISHRFSKKRISIVSLIVAAISAVGTALMLRWDMKSVPILQICWVCCGYFILYVTAARATYTARFYGTFATHLKTDSDQMYPLDPAHSTQVVRIAWVGQRVLLFWFGIVCLVATLFPLFVGRARHFVELVVPIASFFSVVFGTIVFLNSERDIRVAVKERMESSLISIEGEIVGLYNRRSTLDELQWERLTALIALREKLIATGSYRSVFTSSLSLLVPLIGPAVAAISPQIKVFVKPLLKHWGFK